MYCIVYTVQSLQRGGGHNRRLGWVGITSGGRCQQLEVANYTLTPLLMPLCRTILLSCAVLFDLGFKTFQRESTRQMTASPEVANYTLLMPLSYSTLSLLCSVMRCCFDLDLKLGKMPAAWGVKLHHVLIIFFLSRICFALSSPNDMVLEASKPKKLLTVAGGKLNPSYTQLHWCCIALLPLLPAMSFLVVLVCCCVSSLISRDFGGLEL